MQQQAAMAKQAPPPPPPAQVTQPAYAAYPANDGGAWQPSRTQPVFAQPQPAQAAYAEPAYAAQPQPAYAAPQQPAYAEPAPSAAMPVSPATQAWLERRRAQQQAGSR
jgi:hypothetical protein